MRGPNNTALRANSPDGRARRGPAGKNKNAFEVALAVACGRDPCRNSPAGRLCGCPGANAGSEPVPPQASLPESVASEEVVVSGEQPGPGLWKVTHGTYVLWILGTVSPLPKNLQWQPRELESVVARSKIIITGQSI